VIIFNYKIEYSNESFNKDLKMTILHHTPTLKDVADAAGVSIGTASAALNDRSTVSAETRARVMDTAISLGYAFKPRMSQSESAKLEVIGLLIKHDQGLVWDTNPFYSRVQLGVTNTCQRHNISLMVANIEVDASNHPVEWPAMINQQRIDGLIMAGAFIDDTVQMIKRKSDLPIVLVDSYAPTLNCDSIVTDNEGGVFNAVQYLVQEGHTRIGLVGWNPSSPPSIRQRKQGYLEAIRQNGLEPYICESQLSREGGYAAVQKLLAGDRQVTALVCCNDETAIGAMNAIRSSGLRVPQDISLVGFDNIDSAAETNPPLTTVHVHKSWMGSLSVQALIERVRHPEQPKITTVLSTNLVVRETVANIKEVTRS
jgi:LacI family transcriptional regulator